MHFLQQNSDSKELKWILIRWNKLLLKTETSDNPYRYKLLNVGTMNTIFLFDIILIPFPYSSLIRKWKRRKVVTRFISIKDEKDFFWGSFLLLLILKAWEIEKELEREDFLYFVHFAIRFDSDVTEVDLRVYKIGSRIWHNICDYSNCLWQLKRSWRIECGQYSRSVCGNL